MSIVSTLTEAATPRLTQWHEPEPDFYVGSRKGDSIGTVAKTAVGTFIAFDGLSTAVGRYASLAEAQRALVSLAGRGSELDERSTRIAQFFATAAGTVTVILLAGAASLPV